MEKHPDSEIIDQLGGAVTVAQRCDVSSQAVSQWRKVGIPKARRMYLQVLFPEVFASSAAVAASAQQGARHAA